ncbi:hypothetical protein ACFL9U_07765 [Thermodesulfobacteriota bacterium]
MKRIGIFGWGVVAPKSPDVETFEKNLGHATSWLEPHLGFGPSNFLVGRPDFDFSDYKPWIDNRFGPRKYTQLDQKMGNMVKYAIGAFIQSLGQNPGVEELLQDLGTQAHVYVGTGLGDFPMQYERVLHYHKAQKRWNRFWCGDANHQELAAYRQASADEKQRIRNHINAPPDPEQTDFSDDDQEDVVEDWCTFWIMRSDGLKRYPTRSGESGGYWDNRSSAPSALRRHILWRQSALTRRTGLQAIFRHARRPYLGWRLHMDCGSSRVFHGKRLPAAWP